MAINPAIAAAIPAAIQNIQMPAQYTGLPLTAFVPPSASPAMGAVMGAQNLQSMQGAYRQGANQLQGALENRAQQAAQQQQLAMQQQQEQRQAAAQQQQMSMAQQNQAMDVVRLGLQQQEAAQRAKAQEMDMYGIKTPLGIFDSRTNQPFAGTLPTSKFIQEAMTNKPTLVRNIHTGEVAVMGLLDATRSKEWTPQEVYASDQSRELRQQQMETNLMLRQIGLGVQEEHTRNAQETAALRNQLLAMSPDRWLWDPTTRKPLFVNSPEEMAAAARNGAMPLGMARMEETGQQKKEALFQAAMKTSASVLDEKVAAPQIWGRAYNKDEGLSDSRLRALEEAKGVLAQEVINDPTLATDPIRLGQFKTALYAYTRQLADYYDSPQEATVRPDLNLNPATAALPGYEAASVPSYPATFVPEPTNSAYYLP